MGPPHTFVLTYTNPSPTARAGDDSLETSVSSLLMEAHNILAANVPNPAASVPNPERRTVPGLDTKVNQVLGAVAWAGTVAGVLGVLITGSMMAVSLKRGETSEHMSRLGMVLGGCILVASAGPLVGFVFD